ncbi:snf2/rad54 helicase family [Holotrichia oblita]|nr:snf2/rad54 helicase family [Holotrichia oblita]
MTRDGFALINTSAGDRWVYTLQNKIFLEKYYYMYDEADFSSDAELIAPQIVTITQENDDGWLLIETYKGGKWVYMPQDITYLKHEAPVFYQMKDHPTGCESYAATVALNALGIEIKPAEFIEYVPQNITKRSYQNGVTIWGDPDEEFVGVMAGSGYAAYPPVIVNAVNENFSEYVTAENITGAGYDEITSYIRRGGVVLIWYHPSGQVVRRPSTWYTIGGKRIDADYGTHTIAVTGFNSEKGTLIVCDSIDGRIKELKWSTFARTYNGTGISDVEIKPIAQNTVITAKVLTGSTWYTSLINFSPEGYINTYKCNCESSFIWKGACVHTAALFMHCVNQEGNLDMEHQSIEAAKKVAKYFEKATIAEIDEEIKLDDVSSGEKVHLLPVFSVDEENLPYLTFSIGFKRMYIVKSVKDFIGNINSKASFSYGKDLSLNHSMTNFDADSVRLIEFIKTYYDVYDTVRSKSGMPRYYYQSDNSNSKALYIYKKGMDEFFNLYADNELASFINDDKGTIRFTGSEPDLKIRLNGNADRIDLTCGLKHVHKLEGDKHDYLIMQNELFRVDKKYTSFIWPLLGEIFKTSSIKLTFDGKEAASFLTYILPQLKKYGMVKDLSKFTEHIEIYDLIKKLYIDVGDNKVFCKIVFCYGEKEFLYSKKIGSKDGFRDITGEYKISHMVRSMGFTAGNQEGVLELWDDDKIYNFYYYGIEQLKNEAEIYVSEEFKRKIFKPMSKTNLGVRIKEKYHKLNDGRLVDLNDDSISTAAQLISGLNIADKEIENRTALLPKYRALYLDNVANDGNLEIARDKSFKRLANDFKNYKDLEFDVPESLDNILRPYQKVGFNWLKVLAHYGFGGILADDMGLGKTLQVISVILSEKNHETAPSIVVAPTSLIYNWESEINRFAPGLTTSVVSGLPAKRREIIDTFNDGKTDIYITTYDTLKRDIENYEGKRFRYVIADEAQNIKNPMTQNARSVKTLQSDIKYALTGTPIENSLSELWSIFDFIMPGYLFNSTQFTKHYETPIVKNDDKDKATELRKQISPFILRRIKRDVLKELPEKIETTLTADMTDEQRKIYAAHLLQAKGELDGYIEEGFGKNQIRILALLTRLRQICCHPALFLDKYDGDSGKLDLTVETIKTAVESNHRILLFSQFTSMLAIIKKAMDREKIKYFYLDGQTPSRERLEMCERFNGGENELFLISLKAGGTGLNLTGADIVIHYDPWWNPAVMDQASDRAHRFGQKNMVQVINIVAKDSIEEKILSLQQKKKDLVDSVIKEGTSFINKMSVDEVKELFSAAY